MGTRSPVGVNIYRFYVTNFLTLEHRQKRKIDDHFQRVFEIPLVRCMRILIVSFKMFKNQIHFFQVYRLVQYSGYVRLQTNVGVLELTAN